MTRTRYLLGAVALAILATACNPPQPAPPELDALTVAAAGPITGYSRAEFGPAWSDQVDVAGGHNGCDTRNDILARDLQRAQLKPGSRCVVVAGTLQDPYTGQTITFSKTHASAVQIDHIYPLGLAWQHGAESWPASKRRAFANDPRNLLAVDGPQNEGKGDKGPGQWMPPDRSEGCDYATRFATVTAAYALSISAADKDALQRALNTCPAAGTLAGRS